MSTSPATGNDPIFADDDRRNYIDCGVYASPNSLALDSDTVSADRVLDGDPIDDILYDCEDVF